MSLPHGRCAAAMPLLHGGHQFSKAGNTKKRLFGPHRERRKKCWRLISSIRCGIPDRTDLFLAFETKSRTRAFLYGAGKSVSQPNPLAGKLDARTQCLSGRYFNALQAAVRTHF